VKISTKSRYGTRAVLEIALNGDGGKLTRKQISQNQAIPSSYLVNILISLKSNGIIRTTRGPNGGYELAVEPENISIFQLVEILEGHFEVAPCLEDESNCNRSSICITRGIWVKLQKAQEEILKNITIKGLVEETQSLYSPTFSI